MKLALHGEKQIFGRQTRTTYQLNSGAPDQPAARVRHFYVAEAQKAGAQLVSEANAIYEAVLVHKKPRGSTWYFYDHGSGNEQSTGSYTLTMLEELPLPQEVQVRTPTAPLASTGKDCADPPWLKKQFSYFKVADCNYRDLDSLPVHLADGQKVLVGRVFSVDYVLTDAKRDPVAVYVKNNFVNALTAIGAKEVSDPKDIYNAVLVQKTSNGDFWYIYEHTSGSEDSTGGYSLMTLEEGGPPPKACTLEVYGVNFDFDKATLRPDSEPVLQQVLALFTGDSSYEVGGHTDNVGDDAYNMKLSGQRADAVKAWLVAHGIAGDRITTHGYGASKPLVPNTSDANRARNRRVELKRAQCKGP